MMWPVLGQAVSTFSSSLKFQTTNYCSESSFVESVLSSLSCGAEVWFSMEMSRSGFVPNFVADLNVTSLCQCVENNSVDIPSVLGDKVWYKIQSSCHQMSIYTCVENTFCSVACDQFHYQTIMLELTVLTLMGEIGSFVFTELCTRCLQGYHKHWFCINQTNMMPTWFWFYKTLGS